MKNITRSTRKIFSQKTLAIILKEWRRTHEKIVFTNGCFDILHPGHIEYLTKASDLGTKLIIGLNSDTSIKRLKGEKRPVISEKYRALMLASYYFVDGVVIFEEDTPWNLIATIKPNVLVKGADYKVEEIVGYDVVIASGGIVETIKLVEGFSTSALIEKIKQL
ncbi:MAG: D-glycero-beta-D-manno-heptose 1-phosphate adenylyltransferase [Bacteroidia bacterium]|nr:D-glycero-beta-D-manno-heptose 1-phosphate adenylyltransferase [Bacteroidia bacterium]